MRKATISKNYLICCLREYLNNYPYKVLKVREIARYSGISTSPIYLNFSNAHNYKCAMIKQVFFEIFESENIDIELLDPLIRFWYEIYLFATNNKNLFLALFVNGIDCGSYINQSLFIFFKKSAIRSEIFEKNDDLVRYYKESLIYFVGFIIVCISNNEFEDNETFIKVVEHYWRNVS